MGTAAEAKPVKFSEAEVKNRFRMTTTVIEVYMGQFEVSDAAVNLAMMSLRDQSDEGTRYAWELYTYRGSSYERRNSFARLRKRAWVRDLRRRVVAWADCSPHECRHSATIC